ncbi:tetratricopeptide repeat protein [Flavobacterium sp.]|uniref:tetratricopeptide repeat protein n=1 Tax=Flavobacterium sp. TaxID=239 RepID=UPI0039E4DE0B
MKTNKFPDIRCLLLVLLSLLPIENRAQQSKETDSLLKIAVLEVYNNPTRSIEIAQKIYKMPQTDSKLKIKSLMAMAQANVMLTRYEKTLENADEALRIAKETNDYNNQIVIHNFLGNHYFRLELKDKAWQSLKVAEDLLRNHPPADSSIHLKGNVYLLKGYLYADKLDCDYAIIYFDKAAESFEKATDKQLGKINLGVVYTHKGRCLLDNGKLKEAEQCFQKAVRISEESNNIGVNVFSRFSLSQVYAKQQQYARSNALLLETIDVAKEAKQMELIKEIYHQLSENYLSTNNLKMHAHYDKLYNLSLKDFDQSETQSVGKIAHKATDEVVDDNQAAGIRPGWIAYVLGGLVLVIAIVFFAVFKLKRKIKKP